MSGDTLIAALALVLVFEGILPFVSPQRWRRVFEQVLTLTDGQLRFIGLLSMSLGLLGLLFINL